AAAFAAAHAASAQLPAAESGLELTWQAPPECPQPDLVRAAIGELVGGAPDEPIATRIEVRGSVATSPQGYQVWLSLRTREADEQRLLEAASCAELSRASALVVAFAIGTERETTERDAGATENPGPGEQQATAPATAAPRGVSSEEIVFPDLDL